MPTSRLVKDLYMLQETANCNLELGASLVSKADIERWFRHYEIDPDGKVEWEEITSALQFWETEGYIEILADLRTCKHKDYCFKTLRRITAIPVPPDLLED